MASSNVCACLFSENGAAALIIMCRVHVVLLVRLDQNDLFERLAHLFILYLIAKGYFVLQTLLLAVWLALAFGFNLFA